MFYGLEYRLVNFFYKGSIGKYFNFYGTHIDSGIYFLSL